MKISVIGGGPIGCFAAYLLAKNGHSVSLYENHASIGAPIQCTGILTSDFDEFGFDLDSFLVNTIDTIEVNSPQEKILVNQKDYIVCRNKFDNFFADLAFSEGVEINVGHSFLRKEGEELVIKDSVNGVEKRVYADLVIAADGPLSPTAKEYGFFNKKRENFYGIQATVEGEFTQGTIRTFFGKETCPGLFAWITPESSNTARVGLATKKNTKHYFDKFMKEQEFVATAMQAGTIPIYHPNQILQKDNCYLVGDASSYVKATTLGGIVPAMKQVQILVDCIVNGKNYTDKIKPIRKQMWTHLQVHKVFQKFSDSDWDKLLRYVKQPKISKVFEKYTRDNPVPLVLGSLVREPRFLSFMKYIF